jgi:peptidoglycan/LPS O-acetylase OafA/YrhL
MNATTQPSPAAAGPTRRPSRIRELDALRGIAALMVVLYHYTVTYDSSLGHEAELWFSFAIGRQGVELFFIISGFVILMTLERVRDTEDFALARASRLFPTYWLSVLLTAAAVTVFALPGHEVTPGQVLVNLTMLQTFVGVDNVDGVYWTMAVELAFYGWMLLILAAGLLPRIERVLSVWLIALTAIVIVFVVFQMSLPWGTAVALLLYHGHLFIAGMLFYRLRSSPSRVALTLIVATFAIEALFRPASMGIVGAWYALFILLQAGRLGFLNRPPLLFLGTISYPLYLLHENIGFIVIRQLYAWQLDHTLTLILVPLALSIALATAVHFVVEVPAQRAVRSWTRRRQEHAPGRNAASEARTLELHREAHATAAS